MQAPRIFSWVGGGGVDAVAIETFCLILITIFYKSWHKYNCHITDFVTDLIHIIVEFRDSLT